MSKTLSFVKMVASGNDFIVIDHRKAGLKNLAAFTKQLCQRHTGVGADGVLLLESSRKAMFKMRILNSDGSEAEACGNGFRCAALYAVKKMGLRGRLAFESLSGRIEANVEDGRVRVGLVKPTGIRLRASLDVLGHRLHYSFVNTGVPHAVIFVQGLDKMDILPLGRAMRNHADFAPKGTNVNFVEVKSDREIHVRTYERGVENETLACGTGSTASAIASALLGYTRPPVRVRTRGGEVLRIDFKREGDNLSGVTLEGGAEFVYEGKVSLS